MTYLAKLFSGSKKKHIAATLIGARTTLFLFFVVLAILFHGVFLPDQTLFSNDGPLGELMTQCHQLPGSVVVLDNARFHQSPTTLKLVEAAGCQRLFLTSCSPDLNSIEHLWAACAKNFPTQSTHSFLSPICANVTVNCYRVFCLQPVFHDKAYRRDRAAEVVC
jgi:transposase